MSEPHSDGQSGQVLVEFALASVLLTLILMGILDLGRGVATSIALSHAVREGARIALYESSSDADIRSAVRAQAGVAAGLTDGQIVITPSGTRASGDTVHVTVSYTLAMVTPLINAYLPGGSVSLAAGASAVVQ